MAVVTLWRDGVNSSKAYWLLCLGAWSLLPTTVDHQLAPLGHRCVLTAGEEWGPLARPCSVFISRPESSHLFQQQVFFLCTVWEFSAHLSVRVKQMYSPNLFGVLWWKHGLMGPVKCLLVGYALLVRNSGGRRISCCTLTSFQPFLDERKSLQPWM